MTGQNSARSTATKPIMLAAKVGNPRAWAARAGDWLFSDLDSPLPRTWQELLLLPFYLLPLLSALQLVIPSPPSSGPTEPVALVILGAVVGAFGLVYPSRGLAVIALGIYWLGVLAVLAFPFPGGWMVALLAVIFAGLFAALALWVEGRRRDAIRTRKLAKQSDDYLAWMATFLADPLAAIRAETPRTVSGTDGTTTLIDLIAVEVTRHFDSTLEASINGGFTEWMRYRGVGASMGLGRVSLGLSRGRGWGGGAIELDARGTIRDDMTNDSFTAVLARGGSESGDVLRLVVPAAVATQEYVRQFIWDWQRSLGIDSAAELAVRTQLDGLPDKLVCDASYVGDRLSAISRLDRATRPPVSVVGAPVGEHALLAAAIQFVPDGEWYQLFPVALINAIVELMNGRKPTPPPTPKQPASESQTMAIPGSNGQPAAAAASAGASSETALAVSTIGRLSLVAGKHDLTNQLTQKPVASFIWLYLLARALRNPKDAISRSALADEVFPNVETKQQRTRLRQRLSDMQASLQAAASRCLVLEGERVRFDLEVCQVDAGRLRQLVMTLAALKVPLDEAQLRDAELLASSIGEGTFLPDWEALEDKVTGSRGSAATVVEEVRSDIDRWRAMLLVSIADAYSARGRHAQAVAYLEQINRHHPDDEAATKKLIAAYLESGQTAKARNLQDSLTSHGSKK